MLYLLEKLNIYDKRDYFLKTKRSASGRRSTDQLVPEYFNSLRPDQKLFLKSIYKYDFEQTSLLEFLKQALQYNISMILRTYNFVQYNTISRNFKFGVQQLRKIYNSYLNPS